MRSMMEHFVSRATLHSEKFTPHSCVIHTLRGRGPITYGMRRRKNRYRCRCECEATKQQYLLRMLSRTLRLREVISSFGIEGESQRESVLPFKAWGTSSSG